MRKLVLVIATIFYCNETNGQVGIGTTSPHNSAVLDVSGSDKGLLIPRISLTGTNDVSTITSPETSLLVYNTATIAGANAVTPGFYYYTGSAWAPIANQPQVFYDANNNLISTLSGDSLLTGNGNGSVALGNGALSNTGSTQVIRSIAIGNYAGENNTGDNNIIIGEDAFRNPRGTGRRAIAIGTAAARFDSTTNVSGLIAIGDYAGQYNEGTYSTLLGYYSGRYNEGTHSNTLGYFAGYENTGIYVNAIGSYAGRANKGSHINSIGFSAGSNIVGNYINAIGYEACRDDSTVGHSYINAIGFRAGLENRGVYLNGIGYHAGGYNTGTHLNTIGLFSGQNNTGNHVISYGSYAGRHNTGHYLHAIGYQAGHNNKGDHNIALGYRAMADPDDINYNIAIGRGAAEYDSSGVSVSTFNTMIGYFSGHLNKGQYVTAMGYATGHSNQGDNLIALGENAGRNNEGDRNTYIGRTLTQAITGNDNILIGHGVTVIDPAESNQININDQIIADKDGNIGLGVAVPTQALDVDGNVKISGLTGTRNENVYTGADGVLRKGGVVNLAYSSTAPGGQIPVGYNVYRDIDGFYHSTITLPSSGQYVGEIFTFNHLASFNTTISTTNTNMSSSLLVTSSMGGAAFVWSGSKWMLIT